MSQVLNDIHIYEPPIDDGLDIIYQDDDIIAVSKPAGLLSVNGRNPTPENKLGDSLHSRVMREYPDARVIHRLDMMTSGLMVLGLNAEAHRHISMQFEKRQTEKTYIAIVWGIPKGTDGGDSGRVDLPLRCDWERRPRQIVDHELGKSAQTDWAIAERGTAFGGNTSRLVLKPITGRTHQLRVHMQELGTPILGDDFYAHEDAYRASNRLLLHAQDLRLTHPRSDEVLELHAPCPF